MNMIAARQIKGLTGIRKLIADINNYRHSDINKTDEIFRWSHESICLRFNFGTSTFPRYLIINDPEAALIFKLKFGV